MMKIITTIFIATFLIFNNSNLLQAQESAIQSFQTHLKSGNVGELLKDVSENIDLNLNGERKSVDKTQFKSVMQKFMNDNPVNEITEKHKGSAGTSSYAILNYMSSKGIFKITIKTDGTAVKRVDISKQ